MKAKATTTILTILFGLALGASLRAANIVVELGQNIQTKVAASQAGDVVIVRAGEYQNQTISVDKPIRLVREKGTTVTIGGSLTYADVNGTVVLRDFTLLAAGKGSLSLSNCTKFGLENLTKLTEGITIAGSTVVIRDCAFTGNLTISGASSVEMVNTSCLNLTLNGSDLKAVDCNFGNLSSTGSSSIELGACAFGTLTTTDCNVTMVDSNYTTGTVTRGKALFRKCNASGDVTFSQCDWQDHESTYNGNLTSNQSHSKLVRSTVKKAFTHGHASYGGTNLDCVVFQSTIGRQSGDVLLSKATRTWVTYSTIHHAFQEGGTEAHFIGNQVYVDVAKGNNGISLNGVNCVTTIANNHFYSTNTTNDFQLAAQDGQYNNINDTSWHIAKTFDNVNSAVSKVRNQLYNGGNHPSYPTRCKMRFFYTDGSAAYSVERTRHNSNWDADYYYPNPQAAKFVIKIEIHVKQSTSNGSYRAHERHTKVYANGHGVAIGDAKKVDVLNNLFRNWDKYGHCVLGVNSPTDGLFVHGNAFWSSTGSWAKHAVSAPKGADRFVGNSPVPAPDLASHNYFHLSNYGVTGGLVNSDNFSGGDPGFVNNSNDWTLKVDSILVDKGPVEPEHRDHNGSRNDVGFQGGHLHDPAGATSVIPVVLSADQSTFKISEGDATPLVIKARAAVTTP